LKELKLSGEEVRALSLEEIKSLPLIQGKVSEAATSLNYYHDILKKKYGEHLKLRQFAVISVGIERLVWEER